MAVRGLAYLVALLLIGGGQAADGGTNEVLATVIDYTGPVEYRRAGATTWDPVYTNRLDQPRPAPGQEPSLSRSLELVDGDRLRTLGRGKASLKLRDGSTVRLDEYTTIQLAESRQRTGIRVILDGVMSFFHRQRPDEIEVEGGGVYAIVRGTEFAMAVTPAREVTVTLYDGRIDLRNAEGSTTMESGDIAVARPGEKPTVTAKLEAGDFQAIQWTLYYPAILELAELGLNTEAESVLAASLERYRRGALPEALAAYPLRREPATPAERVYLAALLLAIGNVAEAEQWLLRVPATDRAGRLAQAQQRLVAVVRSPPDAVAVPDRAAARLATEWMADSYVWQARKRLEPALAAAREATRVAPDFGFAWARVGELEFSFGRTAAAETALARARALTPGNAQAAALHGFMLAARNRIGAAQQAFEEAIALDAALGNAWLGRGLCRIRRGDLRGGGEDLQTAAAMEQSRSLFRSYLGKAFADEGRSALAVHELALARKLDPGDPTPLLYRALVNLELNRVNDAIRDLQTAEQQAGNRAVYRSEPLLDQDRAVLAANRSAAYRDAGLLDVSVREAGRAVSYDYANPSAHLFLAQSYVNAERVNLRYETPRVSEYLIANLLAPVGSGVLSPALSAQEYSLLFERDRPRAFSLTEYGSRGDWLEDAVVYGTCGTSAYLVEGFHQSVQGWEPNADYVLNGLSVQYKQQVGAQDSLYLQTQLTWWDGGDLAFYRDPNQRSPDLRFTEEFLPTVVAGWQHRWNPEHRSLLMVAYSNANQDMRDPSAMVQDIRRNRDGTVTTTTNRFLVQSYATEPWSVTVEGQHIWQTEWSTAIGGVRYQVGAFATTNDHTEIGTPRHQVQEAWIRPDLERFQVYAYDTVRIVPTVHLVAGLSYDCLTAPANFRYAPIADGQETYSQFSPKAGFVWNLRTNLTLRGDYARSLGGVSCEQSFRLEPTQVAGFNQAFRSLIPETIVGPLSAPDLHSAQVAFEGQFGADTFWSVGGEWLESDADRRVGVYEYRPGDFLYRPAQLAQALWYRERAATASLSRLLGRDWSLGARYRVGHVELTTEYPEDPGVFDATTTAWVQRLDLFARFNHPCGAFAAAEAAWLWQDTEATNGDAFEDVWQFNVFAGYRLWRRRVELALGVVNLTDQDHRFGPLGLDTAPERERTFVARLKLSF